MANKLFENAITINTASKVVNRAKVMLFGTYKVGKSTAASQLPKTIFIDTENAERWVRDSVLSGGGIIKKISNFDEVDELTDFLLLNNPGIDDNGNPYEYWNLVIDSLTPIYLNLQDKLSKDGGGLSIQQWGKLKSIWKNFMLKLTTRLDMNVFVTVHETTEYGADMIRLGVKPDSEKRDPHWFDFIFQLELQDRNDINSSRMAVCKGQRSPMGKPIFPNRFRWDYTSFHKYFFDFFGEDILERTPVAIKLATDEQVEKLNGLINMLNYPEDKVQLWLDKASVDSIAKLSDTQIGGCIAMLDKERQKRAKELADGSIPNMGTSNKKKKAEAGTEPEE